MKLRHGLTQADSFAHSRHNLIGDFVGPLGAASQNVVDIRFVTQDFVAPFSHRLEVLPQFFKKFFLEIAVAGAALFESVAQICNFRL